MAQTNIFPVMMYSILPQSKLDNLPEYNIGTRVGHTEYIDFLLPDELPYPIMQGYDIFKRKFIAFKYIQNQKLRVFTFFQRYLHNNLWVIGGSKPNDMDPTLSIYLNTNIYLNFEQKIFIDIICNMLNDEQIIYYNFNDTTHMLEFPGLGG